MNRSDWFDAGADLRECHMAGPDISPFSRAEPERTELMSFPKTSPSYLAAVLLGSCVATIVSTPVAAGDDARNTSTRNSVSR